MLHITIPEGALFYWQTRHREIVNLTAELRAKVADICRRMHEMHALGITPPPLQTLKRCTACSLRNPCLPRLKKAKRVRSYIAASFEEGDD
jgi:CRISPR-associated exonuclease Cas4